LLAIGNALDEAAFILERTSQKIVDASGLAGLLEWYVQGQYYDLEYAHARALMSSMKIKEEPVRSDLQIILSTLQEKVRDYLDDADHELARWIQQNWYGYRTSPELATNVLIDFVVRPRLMPTEIACLWLIIFDGMRYDSWEGVVKPRLQSVFDIKKEKAYLCVLPSWTSIARTSMTAAKTPDMWKGYNNNFTYNQAMLAGKFFGLPENQYQHKLRFYSGMESDRTVSQFDRNRRYPYNILIFNVSDDDLHKQRNHVGALNENIKSAVDQILHGFTELEPGYATVVRESSQWQRYMEEREHPVRFRFIRSQEPIEGLLQEHILEFDWKIPDGRFTVAIGRRWFQREGSKFTVRYDHGGISFSEMVVPGAVLQTIREKKIDLRLEGLPEEISVNEGERLDIQITITNRGNQPGHFDLQYDLDTDRAPRKIGGQVLPAGENEVSLMLNPVILPNGRKTNKLTLILTYLTVKGQTQTRRQDIHVKLVERKDIVEISLGGLDDLDL
jgi:hypothetical protein